MLRLAGKQARRAREQKKHAQPSGSIGSMPSVRSASRPDTGSVTSMARASSLKDRAVGVEPRADVHEFAPRRYLLGCGRTVAALSGLMLAIWTSVARADIDSSIQ